MIEIDLKKDRLLFVTDNPEQSKIITESLEKFKVISTNCEVLIMRNYK